MGIYSTTHAVACENHANSCCSSPHFGSFCLHHPVLTTQSLRVFAELVWAKRGKKKGVFRPCLHYPGSRIGEIQTCDETAQPPPIYSTVASDPVGWFHNADTTAKALSMWYSWTTNRSPELWSSSSTGSRHGGQHTLCLAKHGDSCRLTTAYCCVLPLHGELHLALIAKHTDIPCFTPEHQSEFSWNPSTPPFHSTAFCRNSALAMQVEQS